MVSSFVFSSKINNPKTNKKKNSGLIPSMHVNQKEKHEPWYIQGSLHGGGDRPLRFSVPPISTKLISSVEHWNTST